MVGPEALASARVVAHLRVEEFERASAGKVGDLAWMRAQSAGAR